MSNAYILDLISGDDVIDIDVNEHGSVSCLVKKITFSRGEWQMTFIPIDES